jgi:hypothetical protein
MIKSTMKWTSTHSKQSGGLETLASLAVVLALAANSITTRAAVIAHWTFDESSGPTAHDSAGSFHGSLSPSGAAFVSGGISGNALLLSRASNGFVNMGDVLGLTSGDFSLAAWVKMSAGDTTAETVVLGKHAAFYDNGYLMGINSVGTGGQVNKAMFYEESVFTAPVSTTSVNDGNWHQIVAVYQSGGNKFIYVDGAPAEGIEPSQAFLSTLAPFLIGGDAPGGIPRGLFTGLIDDVQIYNQALSAGDVDYLFQHPGQVVAVCVYAPPGMVGWWRAEGNGLDETGGNTAALLNGATFTNGEVGQAFLFDGVDDRVIVSNAPTLNFGPGQNFSIEAWIQPITAVTDFGVQSIVNKRFTPNFTAAVGYEFCLADGKLSCQLADAPLAALDFSSYTSPGPDLRDGLFHHVAMTVDRMATNGGKLYVDGQVVLTFDPTLQPGDLSTTEPLRIGNHADPALNSHFKGRIDEVALYNRALTAAEVQAIHTAGSAGKCAPPPPPACVTPPPGLVGWWPGETNANDIVEGSDGTAQGTLSFAAGKVGQAFDFSGSLTGVVVTASPKLNVGLADGFSIETWIKPSTIDLERPIVEWNSVTGGNPYPYGVHLWISVPVGYGAGPGCLYANIVDTAGAFHWLTSAGGLINTHAYQHVALTYDKTSGQALLYLDGTVVASENLGSFTPQTSYNLYLGWRPGGLAAAYSWAGQMDEVSIYNRVLSAAELQAIVAAGSAGKCVTPPSPAYDVAKDFSTNSNPNGAWTYGYSTTLGGAFIPHLERGLWGPLEFWRTDIWLGVPGVYHNPGSVTATNITAVLEPGQLAFHPGPNGEYCVIRFTTPTSGVYRVVGAFKGVDTHGTTTDVHIIAGGIPTLDGLVNGFGPGTGPAFDFTVTLGAGGIVDFAVGRGSNNEFSYDSTGISVQVFPGSGTPPSILSQPESLTVNAGNSAAFTVNASGTAPLAYQWFFGSNSISGATSNVLVLSGVQPANAGSYSVVVSNAYGTATSSNAVLTVLTYPPTITLQPKSATIYEGQAASFTVSASGTAPLKYQWCFNGSPLAGKTTTALALTGVQTNQAGNYWAVVTNAYGSATSSTALLTVLPPPPCVPLPSGAVAWWRAESNTWDSVGINDATYSGIQTQPSWFTVGKVGAAFRTAVRAYFIVPASDELDVGAGEGLTVEGWVKPDSLTGYQPMIEWNDGKGNVGAGLSLNSSYLDVYLTDTNTTPVRRVVLRSPAGVLTNTTWRHVALTFDKTSGLAALFINGLAVAQTNVGTFRPQTQAQVFLGFRPLPAVYGGSYFVGGLDEFTIYNRTLSPAEIQAIVAADISGKCPPPLFCATPPSDFVAWWRGESNALDSVDGNHGVITQAVAFTNGAVGKCFQFNGGYVRVPATSNLNVGLGNGLTLEAWVYLAKSPTMLPPLIEWNSGTGTQGVSLTAVATTPAASLRANLVSTSGLEHLFTSQAILKSGTWQHVALTYDTGSGLAALYVNGSAVTQTNLGSFTPRTSLPVYFGYRPPGSYTGSNTKFTGGLDEISLYARALTAAEIKAIVMARGEGKCKEPPAIVTQPAGLRVNVGADAQFSVVATGNPLLRYQWFKEGTPLPNVTGTSLLLPAVQDADAGNYTVRITNWFGSVLSSNAVLQVNHPPVARIVVAPLAELPGFTNLVVIAPVCAPAKVVLDGSRSSDVDYDSLQYVWTEGTNQLATGVIVTNLFAPGSHTVTLTVNDGLAEASAAVTIEVLAPARAVAVLEDLVRNAQLNPWSKIPLLAILHAAGGAFEQCHALVGFSELMAFQQLVRAEVPSQDPALAEALRHGAQEIMDSLRESHAGGQPPFRFTTMVRQANGHAWMQFDAPQAGVYRIEASTNFVDWETIGVAARRADGAFEFEDVNAGRHPSRFYRIVSP